LIWLLDRVLTRSGVSKGVDDLALSSTASALRFVRGKLFEKEEHFGGVVVIEVRVVG